jgi:deazaflavin-dependent oxidoreductase (nitroreductase family)
MPYPRWLAKLNKRIFNPLTIRRQAKPVVVHVGRRSGRTYQTPTDAYKTATGYVLVVRYGPESDWVRNIMSAGGAKLRVDGAEHSLTSPRLVDQKEAVTALAPGVEVLADFYKAEHYLLTDLAPGDRPATRSDA